MTPQQPPTGMMEWMPIDSAPRDGTYMFLRFPGPFFDTESPGIAVGKTLPGGGWWLTAIWASSTAHQQPDAWMPLPPEPGK
jgi:hypothetical protein